MTGTNDEPTLAKQIGQAIAESVAGSMLPTVVLMRLLISKGLIGKDDLVTMLDDATQTRAFKGSSEATRMTALAVVEEIRRGAPD